jgi:hypothetical protein
VSIIHVFSSIWMDKLYLTIEKERERERQKRGHL